jgi:hypothetical protein
MATYVLPNGRTIQGLSEGYTPEEIKNYALAKGFATEEEYNKNQKTVADLLPLAGEVSGGVAGAIYGAALGTAFLPVAGTALGGLIGGALGTFAGSTAGQYGEAAIENRSAQAGDVATTAAKAAAVDMLFGAAGAGVAKVFKGVIYKPLKEMFTAAPVGTPQLNALEALQQNLSGYGATLLPSQLGSKSVIGSAVETYSRSSLISSEFDKVVEGQDQYITDQFSSLFNTMQKNSREDVGKAATQLLRDTEKGLKEAVDPLYADIDRLGGIDISTTAIKEQVNKLSGAGMGGMGGPGTSAQRSVLQMINALPDSLTPAEATQRLSDIARTFDPLPIGAQGTRAPPPPLDDKARGMLNMAKSSLEEALSGDRFVKTKGVTAIASAARKMTTTVSGTSGLIGEPKKVADLLDRLRPNMSFSEAHQELSYLKALQRDMKASAEPSDMADRMLSRAIGSLTESMDTAAKKFSPELATKYGQVRDMYSSGLKTLYSDKMTKILRETDPEFVGEMLFKTGSVTSIAELESVVRLADSLGVKGGRSVREGLTRGFLDGVFPIGNVEAAEAYIKNMADPRFKDTFTAVVPKMQADRINRIAAEVEILGRHATGQTGSSLAVRSREWGAAFKPGKATSLVMLLLPSIAKKGLSAERMNRKLGALKAMNAAASAGRTVPKGIISDFVSDLGLPEAGATTGFLMAALGTPSSN